jgi:hypothetical protein
MSLFSKFAIGKEKIRQDKEFNDLKEFRKNFDYSDLKDVSWVLSHSKERFKMMKDYVEYLDGKADALIRYLGLGTGVLGLFLKFSFAPSSKLSQGAILIGGVFWIASLLHALSIRQPVIMPYPPSTEFVFKCIKKEDHLRAQVKVAFEYELSAIGQKIVGGIKAKRMRFAYLWLVISLAMFLISFFFNLL